MASLTPGVLSKLIENAGNRDFKATGEHRSPLLQVLEIVPSLPGAGDDHDDPWRSRGFFLKVSDSLHAAYASISDEDLDLIYSDKIQLGQFLYVSRLDSAESGSRVPILRGLKPVAKRRPCVGNPTDLVSSDALPIGRGAGFSKRPIKSKPHFITKNAYCENKPRKLVPSRLASVGNGGSNANQKVGESRRLSLDSARRGWDQSSPPTNSIKSAVVANHIASPRRCIKKAASENGSVIKPPISKTSPLKSKNEVSSQKAMKKVAEKEIRPPMEETRSTQLVQLPLIRSEKKISWSALPSTMAVVGKRAVRYRNLASMAAVHALEEASATEAVLHCMCLFAELSESSQQASPGLMAEQFLELYHSIQQAQTTLNSLINETPSDSNSGNSLENATSWIQAAVATNLSKFSLFRMNDERRTGNFERPLYLVADNTKKGLDFEDCCKEARPSPMRHRNRPLEPSSKQSTSPSEGSFPARKEEWSKASGLEEAAKLAEELRSVSCRWFMKYLENLLNNGDGVSREEHCSETTLHLLRQLKRVNQWLEKLVVSGVGVELNDRTEQLRKKLYRFVLEHVDITVK